MTTISEALAAYRICAKAEGKSQRTIEWVNSSVSYFCQFLGDKEDIATITANDFRRFIIALRDKPKFSGHPLNKTQQEKLSSQTINTYCRAIRAFFGYLHREDLIEANPMQGIRIPKAMQKVAPTLSESELEKLLSQPDRQSNEGFRNYAVMLTLADTAVRLSELTGLHLDDIDLENGYLRVMGKGSKERYVPFSQKVAKALLKYKIKHRPEPAGNDYFWLTMDGRPLTGDRVDKLIRNYGEKAGLRRCYPHKLRHTSSVLFLRNGGDPFTLQKKLGHSSLQMTRHYSNLADSDVRAKHLKYGPIDRLNL